MRKLAAFLLSAFLAFLPFSALAASIVFSPNPYDGSSGFSVSGTSASYTSFFGPDGSFFSGPGSGIIVPFSSTESVADVVAAPFPDGLYTLVSYSADGACDDGSGIAACESDPSFIASVSVSFAGGGGGGGGTEGQFLSVGTAHTVLSGISSVVAQNFDGIAVILGLAVGIPLLFYIFERIIGFFYLKGERDQAKKDAGILDRADRKRR